MCLCQESVVCIALRLVTLQTPALQTLAMGFALLCFPDLKKSLCLILKLHVYYSECYLCACTCTAECTCNQALSIVKLEFAANPEVSSPLIVCPLSKGKGYKDNRGFDF